MHDYATSCVNISHGPQLTPVVILPSISSSGDLAATQHVEIAAPRKANTWLIKMAFFLKQIRWPWVVAMLLMMFSFQIIFTTIIVPIL